jgi:hypothetical protein
MEATVGLQISHRAVPNRVSSSLKLRMPVAATIENNSARSG